MSKVYKCDICGKVEPSSIRNIVSLNPQVNKNEPLNTEKIYGLNLFFGDFCPDCLHKIERKIMFAIEDLKDEERKKKKND